MKSWRPSTSHLVALCVLLTTVLSLAVVIGGRGKGVRFTRSGAHRLDSAEVVTDHAAIDFTSDLPTTPLLHVAAAPLLPADPAQASPVVPAVLIAVQHVPPPAVAGADRQSAGVESIVHRPLRPSPGRAPPAL
jgi:hypothetical protein